MKCRWCGHYSGHHVMQPVKGGFFPCAVDGCDCDDLDPDDDE